MKEPLLAQAKKKAGTPAGVDVVAGLVRTGAQKRALPDGVRAKMETSLGSDFSGVNIIESPVVGQLGMEAVARGNEIAFDSGRFDPSSRTGQELLGHELSHVASQARGQMRGSGLLENDALERQADVQGAMAAQGEALSPMAMSQAAPTQGAAQMSKKDQAYRRNMNRQVKAHQKAHKNRSYRPFDPKRGFLDE